MVERIPLIISQISQLQQGQEEIKDQLKEEIKELKSEHIIDVRKNICRLWQAFDEMRLSVNKICQSLEKLKGIAEGRTQVAHIIFTLVGATMGAVVTLAAHQWLK